MTEAGEQLASFEGSQQKMPTASGRVRMCARVVVVQGVLSGCVRGEHARDHVKSQTRLPAREAAERRWAESQSAESLRGGCAFTKALLFCVVFLDVELV